MLTTNGIGQSKNMAYLIQNETGEKQKKVSFKFPPLSGKFGFSFELGTKQFFLGLAVADIEIETVVKRKKYKIFKNQPSKSRFINFGN